MQNTLDLPDRQATFLRRVFGAAQDHVEEELQTATGINRSRLSLEVDVYASLIYSLDTGEFEDDFATQLVLADLAAAIDADNEYERVIEEHAAIHELMGQPPEAWWAA